MAPPRRLGLLGSCSRVTLTSARRRSRHAGVIRRFHSSQSDTQEQDDTTNTTNNTPPLSSSSSSSQNHHFCTNDGTVEGVWMFVRHGDRTPSRPLCPPHRRDEEAAYWITRLPYPTTADTFLSFSQRFPLDISRVSSRSSSSNNSNKNTSTTGSTFMDVSRNPFGWLTQNGLRQLHENGRRFFQRYNHHGYHFPEQPCWENNNKANDFLKVWDVSVYSTNYLRTVLSVQSFLDGLLGTNCYDDDDDTSMQQQQQQQQQRKFDPKIIKEDIVPNHAWALEANKGNKDESTTVLVPIRIRDLSNDPLNAFDRNPDLIAELVSEVMLSPEFLQRDGGAAPLAARLANILPGLVRKFRSDFSAKSPSGINWVEAADHFVCRKAHGVGFALFTDHEHDGQVEQTLEAMSHPTIAHLAWRFRKWYENKRLLAAIAAPLLREMVDRMVQTPALKQGDKRPFVIYSCHDITILGLLYAVGAEFLLDETSMEARYWPAYASHLVFELVRVTDDSNTSNDDDAVASSQDQDSSDDDHHHHQQRPTTTTTTHVIRVLLNGKPVFSVDFDTKNSLGHGPEELLSIADFQAIVSKLEDDGGHDYDRLLGRQPVNTK